METDEHENKMQELAYVRETERLKHTWRMQEISLKFQLEEEEKRRRFR